MDSHSKFFHEKKDIYTQLENEEKRRQEVAGEIIYYPGNEGLEAYKLR